MRIFNSLALLAIAVVALQAPQANAQSQADYAGMLGYLASSRIDGHAFAGANGAVATNMAAGDQNLQANLRNFASGARAIAATVAIQHQSGNRYDMPLDASASIGGAAFNGASGLVSINQASGSGNAEMNLVAAALASQGIRETTDGSLSSVVSASAGEQSSGNPNVARSGTRSVAVESTALQGFKGVLQLNQVAGSGNATNNQFGLSVQGSP